jgi:hypothetical protein
MSYVDRLVGAMCVVALAGAPACGSDGEPAADLDVASTQVDGGSTPDGSAELTIEDLCDPLDEVVVEWVGSDAERQHLDLFAADDPASLTCEWSNGPDYREIRITYFASPAVWDAAVAGGGEPLDAITADNVYDGEILSVRAQNGWTIDVMAFEGDPPDHADAPEVVTPIAIAALGLTPSA